MKNKYGFTTFRPGVSYPAAKAKTGNTPPARAGGGKGAAKPRAAGKGGGYGGS